MVQELINNEKEIILKMSKSELDFFLKEIEKLELPEGEIEITLNYLH